MSSEENKVKTEKPKQIILVNESDDERLIKKLNRPDIEKFRAFTQMLRTNAMLKQARITHK
ncbi:hypothetical protein [Mucilaginibacter antarcticus]|uniref:Uncharacterized protein n=1 Tax=Mucilaginibacter antarcticus TaxID=1855725 RepID=A0ABW5XKF7_9SPHI